MSAAACSVPGSARVSSRRQAGDSGFKGRQNRNRDGDRVEVRGRGLIWSWATPGSKACHTLPKLDEFTAEGTSWTEMYLVGGHSVAVNDRGGIALEPGNTLASRTTNTTSRGNLRGEERSKERAGREAKESFPRRSTILAPMTLYTGKNPHQFRRASAKALGGGLGNSGQRNRNTH